MLRLKLALVIGTTAAVCAPPFVAVGWVGVLRSMATWDPFWWLAVALLFLVSAALIDLWRWLGPMLDWRRRR